MFGSQVWSSIHILYIAVDDKHIVHCTVASRTLHCCVTYTALMTMCHATGAQGKMWTTSMLGLWAKQGTAADGTVPFCTAIRPLDHIFYIKG